jgi:tRNA threonylcarbamoyladenosine biosynthesis protein TsaB
MLILAIDTSSAACSVALLDDEEITLSQRIAPMLQAQLILPMIAEILESADVRMSELHALAFGRGPGSFTGVRIAASVIQGMGFASKLPLLSVSSLAAAAQAAFHELEWRKILVAMDARINEVYWGAYQVNTHGLVELVGTEIVCRPQEIPIPVGQDWYAIGNGWQEYGPTLLERLPFAPLAIESARLPDAMGVALLAQAKYERKEWTLLSEALPVYIRDNVALKSK